MTVQLVQHTAKEMAGVFYDDSCSKSNKFREMFPNQRDFIKINWKQFIPVAKGALSAMLGDVNVPDYRKKEIYNALIEERWRGTPPSNLFQGRKIGHG